MKKAVLLFPDTHSMADFILTEKISKAEVNSTERTLVAPLNDMQIVKAETAYKAKLKVIVPQRSSSLLFF